MSGAPFARPPRPDGSRPKNPVRAGSLPAGGEWERMWQCVLSPGELAKVRYAAGVVRGRLIKARRKLTSPADRARIPVPSKNGLDILAALASFAAGLARKARRLLALSYAELANRAGCSVETVRRQIALLKLAGLLRWQRRCRRTDAPREYGVPQWEQAENVYELVIPLGVKREHRRAGAAADRRQAEAAAATAQQRASTAPPSTGPRPSSPLAKQMIAGSLAAALDRFRAAYHHETHRLPERPDLQASKKDRS